MAGNELQSRYSYSVGYDDHVGTNRAILDDEHRSLANAITSRVATATESQFAGLPILYDTIDTGMLDDLLTTTSHRSTNTEIANRFQYPGSLVTADSHGIVIVQENSKP